MHKFIITLCAALLCCAASLRAQDEDNSIYLLQPGHDYYIVNTLYDRPLGLSADQSQPRLVTYNASQDAQYIYTAEEAPTEGYVLLRHKATGKYIAASTSNSYSVVTQASKGTSNVYQWAVRPGYRGGLVNLKNTSSALGVDSGETGDYIGVWYDKEPGASISYFEVFEATGNDLASSRWNWYSTDLLNVTNYIESEITNNDKYPSLYRKLRFPASITEARYMAQASTVLKADTLHIKAQHMRDSLATMSVNEISVMLTEADMSGMGSTFSLGMADLSFNSAYVGDSAYVVVRRTNGLGARVTIKEDGSYVFVMAGNKLKVYRNKTLEKTVPAYYLPQYTAQGTEGEWSLIRASRISGGLPELLSSSKEVTEGGGTTTDKNGNQTRTVVSLSNTNLTLEGQIDFHILSESAPLQKCKINLKDRLSWLIFDNVLPSEVISSYLSQIYIDGQAAKEGTNCRVVIYLNGALVMPYNPTDACFTGYDGEQFSGDELGLAVGFHNDLGKNANRFRSFRLKRGYMATLASGTKGSGYSRVYVADHGDLEVPVLPNALYGRITSVVVKKWAYVSKKGYCSTNSNSSIAADVKKLRATWFYTWSADRSSTYDAEYVPIRQHIWWPGMSAITSKDATACLSFNEPEHSEQHNNCDCGGAISAWTACTHTPDFQQTGMRIGAPAPTADSWLTEYINHCNDMAYRCDFVAIHSYWGSNECNDGKAWYNRLKAIYDATKRPIWITEWAYGASWTKESWPSGWSDKLEQNRWRVKDIMQKLEEAPFVERYAYYQWDTQFRNLVDWSDGHITPAGKVYRDMKSDFAYNAKYQFTPVWWAPSLKGVTLTAKIEEADGTLAVTVANPNTDVTDQLTIQRYDEDSNKWVDYYTETERYKFDKDTLLYSFKLSDFEPGKTQLRAYMKRTLGESATSKAITIGSDDYSSFIKNPSCNDNNTTGWTVTNCETSKGESSDGSSSNNYFNLWKSSAFTGTMTQTISGLPAGRYSLSALMRGSTNEKMTITLEVMGTDSAVSAEVTGTGNSSVSGSDYKNGWVKAQTDYVDVKSWQNIRITFQAVGTGGSCWYSVDDFQLTKEYVSTGIEAPARQTTATDAPAYDLTGRRISPDAKGIRIVGSKKIMK